MKNDLTTGSVFRNVVSFSLPYLLSYFLQTLYGMADLFIIGQFEGVASTTAVSIGSQVMHMFTVMLVGLAMGATVSIAQATGGGEQKQHRLCHRQHGHALHAAVSCADGTAARAARGYRLHHVHTGGGRAGHARLSHGLLYRYSVHHGVQHHRLDLPRPW